MKGEGSSLEGGGGGRPKPEEEPVGVRGQRAAGRLHRSERWRQSRLRWSLTTRPHRSPPVRPGGAALWDTNPAQARTLLSKQLRNLPHVGLP